MTARTSLRYPEGTKAVGTARVHEDRTVGRSFAERELMRRTGAQPNSEFDEIAGGAISRVIASAAKAASTIGAPAPLDKPLMQMTKPAPAKRSKYGNKKCESGGIKFDSQREMMRWHDLVRMQERGEIFDLERQVPFVLAPAVVINGRKKPELRYVADFVYETKDGARVIEDVKGAVTAVYAIKRHLMAVRGLEITEVR